MMKKSDAYWRSKWFWIVAGTFLTATEFVLAETEYKAGIQLGVSHTDNVDLSEPPNEIDDLIYRARLDLGMTYKSKSIDSDIRYGYDGYRYDELKTDSSFHSYDASVTGKAIDESLTLQVGARREQVVRNVNQDFDPGGLPLSDNIADRDQWYVNPRLNRSLGSAVTVGMNYRFAETRYQDDPVQRNQNQLATFQLENYNRGQGLTWALRYNWSETDYEFSSPWEYHQASAELGFWINDKARVFATGGKESKWDDPVDRAPQDPFWEAGFAYSAGERLSAEFAAGERSFGSSFRGRLDFTFRRGSTYLSYAETPTAYGYNRRPTSRESDPDDSEDYLTNPGEAQNYISKLLSWTTTLKGRRTGFGLTLFNEERTGRFNAAGEELDNQDQQGITANFSWQAGVRTNFTLSGSRINRSLANGSEDNFSRATIAASYQLGSRTDLSLSYVHTDQMPVTTGGSSRNYVANVVSLFLTFTI